MVLRGRIARDTIRGRWEQSAYCCGAEGEFVMHRRPWSPAADSLIASGLREYAREEQAARAAEAARQSRIGWLRLRVYDEAVQRYIAAAFWAIRNAHDPARQQATLVQAADSGWGEYDEMEPGEYDTVLFEFACGHQTYFADSAYARQNGLAFPVTVRTGERVEREVRIDSRRIKTQPSYENRGDCVRPSEARGSAHEPSDHCPTPCTHRRPRGRGRRLPALGATERRAHRRLLGVPTS